MYHLMTYQKVPVTKHNVTSTRYFRLGTLGMVSIGVVKYCNIYIQREGGLSDINIPASSMLLVVLIKNR